VLISERVHLHLHLWGACGVGKSQIVVQVAADRKCEFLDIRAVQLDPADLPELPECRDPARPGAAGERAGGAHATGDQRVSGSDPGDL